MSDGEQRLDRKLSILAEAERHGSRVVRVLEDEGAYSAFLFRNGDARHVYFDGYLNSLPLSGIRTTPGEHHTILPCPAPTTAGFVADRKAWWSPDSRFAWMLQSLEPSLQIGEQSWRWYHVRGGRTYYRAEWCARIAPSPKGAHLAVRGLQPGAFDYVNLVGFGFFLRAAWAIQSSLAGAPHGVPAAVDTVYDAIATSIFDADDLWEVSDPPALEVGHHVANGLQAYASKTISAGAIDPRRMEFARRVLPPNAAHLPVLAVIGDSFLESFEALVVTPTHGFVRRKSDARASFAWSDVSNVIVNDSDCWLCTGSLGWIPVPGCFEPQGIAQAIRAPLPLHV